MVTDRLTAPPRGGWVTLVSAPGRPSSLPGVMPVDPGFYEDLAGRLYGLLIGLEDRLDSDDAAIIHQFTGARHYGLALEEIARTLAHRTIAINMPPDRNPTPENRAARPETPES
jgi:hypothetical protein